MTTIDCVAVVRFLRADSVQLVPYSQGGGSQMGHIKHPGLEAQMKVLCNKTKLMTALRAYQSFTDLLLRLNL